MKLVRGTHIHPDNATEMAMIAVINVLTEVPLTMANTSAIVPVLAIHHPVAIAHQ